MLAFIYKHHQKPGLSRQLLARASNLINPVATLHAPALNRLRASTLRARCASASAAVSILRVRHTHHEKSAEAVKRKALPHLCEEEHEQPGRMAHPRIWACPLHHSAFAHAGTAQSGLKSR
eukprot:6183547-Pleurochrysis_carterae.AAC.2